MTIQELYDWAKNHDCLELEMNSRDSRGKYCKLDYLDLNIARGEIYINPIEERKVKRHFVYPV